MIRRITLILISITLILTVPSVSGYTSPKPQYFGIYLEEDGRLTELVGKKGLRQGLFEWAITASSHKPTFIIYFPDHSVSSFGIASILESREPDKDFYVNIEPIKGESYMFRLTPKYSLDEGNYVIYYGTPFLFSLWPVWPFRIALSPKEHDERLLGTLVSAAAIYFGEYDGVFPPDKATLEARIAEPIEFQYYVGYKYNSKTGEVSPSFSPEDAPVTVRIVSNNATVTDDGLRVRSVPNLEGKIITHLNKGTKVKILDRTVEKVEVQDMLNYWYKVELPDGKVGWVFGEFLSIEE